MQKRGRVLPRKPAGLKQRAQRLTVIRNLKMARSAHAFVRGSTARFYQWLESGTGSKIPEGPTVWICGDCHTGNLGPVSDADGIIAVQIRDLDQTVKGNPAHDLIRLGLSLSTAIRGSNLPGVTTALAMEAMVGSYAAAVAGGHKKRPVPESIATVLKSSKQRHWRHLAAERIKDAATYFPLGKRFWPVSREERTAIRDLFATPEAQHLVRLMKDNDETTAVVVEDCAYWMKGCSSLGNLRYAVLLACSNPETGATHRCLMDVKEAIKSVAPREMSEATSASNGERVAQGARALSPNLGERMLATRLLDRSVFVRELAPQDLKLNLDRIGREETIAVASYLAAIVGEAHGRQMDDVTRKSWSRQVRGPKSNRKLDTPSWLWEAVVQLVANHEAAYLDHCRKYAVEFSRT